MKWYDMIWDEIKWNVIRCDGMTWHGMTWHDMAWHDMARHDMTWHNMTWHDMTCHAMTWHDLTWHGMKWNEMRWYEMKWDEMKMIWDGMIWYRMKCDDMRWDEMRCYEMRWDGMWWNEMNEMTWDERAQRAGNGAPLPCQEDNLVRERRVGGKAEPLSIDWSVAGTKIPAVTLISHARLATRELADTPMYDERFARQHRYETPPEFPLCLPFASIVHHLSGPNRRSHNQTSPNWLVGCWHTDPSNPCHFANRCTHPRTSTYVRLPGPCLNTGRTKPFNQRLYFEIRVGGPVGHPWGVQIKTLTLKIQCVPRSRQAWAGKFWSLRPIASFSTECWCWEGDRSIAPKATLKTMRQDKIR